VTLLAALAAHLTSRAADPSPIQGGGTAHHATVRAADSIPQCYVDNDWICAYYWKDRRTELIDATQQHLSITVISVLLGFAVALPLGLVARRYRNLESLIIGGTTIVYTIPSLALFSLLLPWTGLTETTVVIGLALYSLTILVRNVLAGLRSVPDEVRESALGLGYGPARLLFKVELPLALPVIMAGVRVATVSTVALVTIGAIVAYGGLGNLLYEAFPSEFKAQIFAASLLCIVLAVVLDIVLVVAQRLMTPWTRVGRSS
jgi:osmoprotectant transport system permease protein